MNMSYEETRKMITSSDQWFYSNQVINPNFYNSQLYQPPPPPAPPYLFQPYESLQFHPYNTAELSPPPVISQINTINSNAPYMFDKSLSYILTVQTTISTGQSYFAIEPQMFDGSSVENFVTAGTLVGVDVCETDDKHEVVTVNTVKHDVEKVNKSEARIGCEVETESETGEGEAIKDIYEVDGSIEIEMKVADPKVDDESVDYMRRLGTKAVNSIDEEDGTLIELTKFDSSHDWGDAKSAKMKVAHVPIARSWCPTWQLKDTSVALFNEDGHPVYGKDSGRKMLDCIHNSISSFTDVGGGVLGCHGFHSNFRMTNGSSLHIDESKMMKRLWVENYFDPGTKKWTFKHTSSFACIQFCYEIIKQIINTCMNDQKDMLWVMLQKLSVTMKSDEEDLMRKPLMKWVMQTWLLVSTALLEMIIFHLLIPSRAQKYRVESWYGGPLDNIYATNSRSCDPNGPLILYVSKMISASNKGRFFAFGPVFAGKVSTGLKVRVMGRNYVPEEKKDLYVKSVLRIVMWMGRIHETVEDVLCGNTVALVDLVQFITKGAILTNEIELDAHPVKAMKFSVSPVVCVAVQYKVASDLSKLAEGLTVKSKFEKLEFGGARMLLATVLRETKGAERVWKVIRESQYHCQPWRTLSVICDCSFVYLCFLNSLSCSIYDKNE